MDAFATRLDELHPCIHQRCGDSGGMRSGILPAIGNRRTMRRFVFDAHLGDSWLRFEQSHRDVADEERAQIGAMTLDGNHGAHSVVFRMSAAEFIGRSVNVWSRGFSRQNADGSRVALSRPLRAAGTDAIDRRRSSETVCAHWTRRMPLAQRVRSIPGESPMGAVHR